jgi:hypothetical protein
MSPQTSMVNVATYRSGDQSRAAGRRAGGTSPALRSESHIPCWSLNLSRRGPAADLQDVFGGISLREVEFVGGPLFTRWTLAPGAKRVRFRFLAIVDGHLDVTAVAHMHTAPVLGTSACRAVLRAHQQRSALRRGCPRQAAPRASPRGLGLVGSMLLSKKDVFADLLEGMFPAKRGPKCRTLS